MNLPPHQDAEEYVEEQLEQLHYEWGWIRYPVFFTCIAILSWFLLPAVFVFDVVGTREVAAFVVGFVALFVYIVVNGD